MKKRKKLLLIVLSVIILISALYVLIFADNKTIGTTFYTVSSEDLPKSFDGFTVVQVSDLHNDLFGENNCELIAAIKAASPDIIVLTGDIMDSYDTNLEIACDFIDGIADIAPIYYVTGNHEYRFPITYDKFEAHMKAAGVTVLHNKSAEIELDGETITVCGTKDPLFSGIPHFEDTPWFEERLMNIVPDEGFSILLSHRPDIFDLYCRVGANLVLSGHAHGGQLRLPFIGAILVPGQPLFPKYADGIHTSGDTTLIISRGLGNSSFPIRVNNPPELVVVTLKAK